MAVGVTLAQNVDDKRQMWARSRLEIPQMDPSGRFSENYLELVD